TLVLKMSESEQAPMLVPAITPVVPEVITKPPTRIEPPVVVESNIDLEPTDLDAIESRILQRAQTAALQRAESKNAEAKTSSPPNAAGSQLRLTEALNQLEGTRGNQFPNRLGQVHSKMFMQP